MNRLPYGINLIFEEDCKHFWLHCPYNKGFIEALSLNMVEREWNRGQRAWRIPTAEFEQVYDLVDQFYGAWKNVPVYGYMEGYSEGRRDNNDTV